ncbi:dihydroneopterin aldolase [Acidihalobacter prosperus]
MDRIFIQDLEVSAVIGVYQWERQITQKLKIDLCLEVDVKRVSATDSLDKGIDYAEVAGALHRLGREKSFNLVETFAEECAARVIDAFDVLWVRIGVTKEVALPGRTRVRVEIERSSQPSGDGK